MKRFECKTLGQQCEFAAEAENEAEVLQKAAEHAAAAHGMQRNPENEAKIRAAIRDRV